MDMHMLLDRMPKQFCEGPFLGNGRMGTVVFVRNGKLVISLDHPGLWELRESLVDEPKATFTEILKNREAFRHGDPAFSEDTNIFDRAIGRTKLPGFETELEFSDPVTDFASDTDLLRAELHVTVTLGENPGRKVQIRMVLHSLKNVLLITIDGEEKDQNPKLRVPGWDLENPALHPLKTFGYEPCRVSAEDGFTEVHQSFGKEMEAVILADQKNSGIRVLSLEVFSREEIAAGKDKAQWTVLWESLKEQELFQATHRADWAAFWQTSSIQIPDGRLQEAWELEMFKLYCNERPGAWPVTLQGIWNPGNRMPAWFGDLHNDLNVQSCYWPACRTGHVELMTSYIDTYCAASGRLMERAKKLYGLDDAISIPVMMTPEGTGAASEWCFWNSIAGTELFVAEDFLWYIAYSGDEKRLREKIYPFLRRVLHLYQGIAMEKEDGYLHLPFMMSPEYDEGDGLLLEDDPTFAVAVLHDLCHKMHDYALLLGEDSEEFTEFERRLVPVTVDETGFPVFAGIDFTASHRHMSHLYPIFPMGICAHNPLAERSLDNAINAGPMEYAAFSFPYLGIMAARCGRGNMARTMLDIYCLTFRSPNSFTVNGDPYQNGVIKVSDNSAGESIDAFTLESGFFIPTLLCEMFAHRCADDIYLQPALPDAWREASCTGIAVEGGHKIDIVRSRYHLAKAVIDAAKDETLAFHWKKEETALHLSVNGQKVPFEIDTDENGWNMVTITLKKGDQVVLG